jgi:cytochrome b561
MSVDEATAASAETTAASADLSLERAHPAPLRLWHWANALVVFGLLGTVLLRKTFLSWRANAVMIEDKALAAGVIVPTDLAVGIAKSLRDVMWEYHHRFGVALAILLVVRVVIALVTKRQPLRDALRGFQAASAASGKDKAERQHFALVSAGYVAFYLSTLFMVVTGLAMLNAARLGLSKGTTSLLKENHELMLWFFVVFVGVHLIGVVRAELTRYRGIVSAMISGRK